MAKALTEPTHWLIIPAAGVGKRMAADIPKQYISIDGKTIIQHTLDRLMSSQIFTEALVGLSPEDKQFSSIQFPDALKIRSYVGGAERADTVLAGLEAISARTKPDDWVWVHDAARPLVSTEDLLSLRTALDQTEVGALLALPCTDTMKFRSDDGEIETIDRARLWRAQTPQVFRFEPLRKALLTALEEGWTITDEASAIEQNGQTPALVVGKPSNIKITHPEDLAMMENILNDAASSRPLDLRVGTGFDVHAFEAGNYVTLGGERIAFDRGLRAHSDGDVLLHALCDALLGALALGDIGHHFPDTDPAWENADSRHLLRATYEAIKEQGYVLQNTDMTIIAQAPKMAPHIQAMRENIAQDLKIDVAQVSVKATTTEKLGFTGRGEGIACQASCLLMRH